MKLTKELKDLLINYFIVYHIKVVNGRESGRRQIKKNNPDWSGATDQGCLSKYSLSSFFR